MVDYYSEGIDQMTNYNDAGINKAIISNLYKLTKYSEIYIIYPSVRSHTLFELGRMFFLTYNSNKNLHSKKLSKQFILRSLIYNPLNIRSWYFLIKLYGGIK